MQAKVCWDPGLAGSKFQLNQNCQSFFSEKITDSTVSDAKKKHTPPPKSIQDHPNPSVQKLNLRIFVGSKQPSSSRQLTSMRIGKLPSSLEPARLKIQGLGGISNQLAIRGIGKDVSLERVGERISGL